MVWIMESDFSSSNQKSRTGSNHSGKTHSNEDWLRAATTCTYFLSKSDKPSCCRLRTWGEIAYARKSLGLEINSIWNVCKKLMTERYKQKFDRLFFSCSSNKENHGYLFWNIQKNMFGKADVLLIISKIILLETRKFSSLFNVRLRSWIKLLQRTTSYIYYHLII